jgi:hypothetical protein
VGLRVFAPVLERVQQLRIQTRQAGQVFGVDLVRFAFVGIDESNLAGVSHQDFVAALFQNPADPRRMSPGLDG